MQAGGRGAKRMSVGGTPGAEGEAAPSDSGADAPAPRKRTRSRTGTAAEQAAAQAAEAARAGSSDEDEAPAQSSEVRSRRPCLLAALPLPCPPTRPLQTPGVATRAAR